MTYVIFLTVYTYVVAITTGAQVSVHWLSVSLSMTQHNIDPNTSDTSSKLCTRTNAEQSMMGHGSLILANC